MLRSLVLFLCAAAAVGADPRTACTSATSACIERVPLGPEGRFSVVYRSYPLSESDSRIKRALIVIHGAGRNADDYFASALAGALIAGTLDDTIVIAPRIASSNGTGCSDKLEAGEISWICGGSNDWRRGGAADGIPNVYTYSLVDQIIRTVTRPQVFPNLESIVVTGHSAGGQFVNRYAAATEIEESVKTPIKYVVSNPSSYLYLDATRLPSEKTCTVKGSCDGEFVALSGTENCAAYNQWHYGLEERSGYAAPVSDAELRKRLVSRDVVYLLGELDTLPLFGFDSSCSAMAQGATRFARGLAYWNYLRSKYHAKHKLVTVPNCGHNGRCMYTSNDSFPVIFPGK